MLITLPSLHLNLILILFLLLIFQALAIKRHKLWVMMAKKEIGRSQKSKASFRKEVLTNCKKMATGCMRHCRQKALQVYLCIIF